MLPLLLNNMRESLFNPRKLKEEFYTHVCELVSNSSVHCAFKLHLYSSSSKL
ncbi:hypothetical protein HYC85_000113 [Camellia sinensis]|uniref:Uncharacterized protein n=1 Tax=Camellia sinensis TaxID=4442 RepID=A0A7J7FPA4_CAMSI|nr:hypothetical protein HYC85_000113 [Camellia sinensis]